MRAAAVLLICLGSVGVAYSCDCSDPPLEDVKARADLVFRGTLVELRPAPGPQGFGDTIDSGKIAVFRVSRVWKGDIGPTFEMPGLWEAAACWGFAPSILKAGNDLLVFAFRMPTEASGTFIVETSICSRTALAPGNPDLGALGAGYAPASPSKAKAYFGWSLGLALTVMLLLVLRRQREARAATGS